MKKTAFLVLFFSISVFATTINIAVAANVSYAIDDLKAKFKQTHPNIDVQTTLGSSGKLTTQIKNGAPYGLFISANTKYPQTLYDEKIAITKPVIYAQGALAFFSIKKYNLNNGITLLTNKNIQRIAIANPKTAPYGKAAFKAIKNAKILDKIKQKLIYAESISQTLSYTITATDIGIVAKSSLYSSKMKNYKRGINWIEVDTKLYTPIEQAMVLLKYSNNSKEYKAFYDFILSDEAKIIFKKYGYITQ